MGEKREQEDRAHSWMRLDFAVATDKTEAARVLREHGAGGHGIPPTTAEEP